MHHAASLGLIALALGTFALGVAEFSIMGILTPLANALHISIPRAGDIISVYAIGVAIGAPLPVLFRKRPLKHILLGLAAMICLGNLCACLSPGYHTLLLFRFLAGLPHGGFFGVGAIVAMRLVAPGMRATAVAVMMTGMTVANIIGVPLVTWLAYSMSWRCAFLGAALVSGLAVAGIHFSIPLTRPEQGQSWKREIAFLKFPGPWLIFAATFLGQGSVYCWYSYMEPIMLNITGIPAEYMMWVMVLAGTGMLAGSLICGRLADRFSASLVSSCAATAIVLILVLIYCLSAFAVPSLCLAFLGTAALFGLGGPMQYLIVRYSRGGEILGGAGIQIAFNLSNALAAWLGGAVIASGFGLTATALAGVPLAIASALCMFCFYKKYGG